MPDAALVRAIFDALKKNLPQYDDWLGDSANPDYIGPKQLREIAIAVAEAIEEAEGS